MLARFGDEKDCMVIDISEDGLAVIARENHSIGKEVTFEMWIRSTLYRGIVEIRSVATAARGKFRYGLLCLPDVAHHNLSASLRDLSVDLQVKYLQRLSI